jgi:preprotein translocase subunit SecF
LYIFPAYTKLLMKIVCCHLKGGYEDMFTNKKIWISSVIVFALVASALLIYLNPFQSRSNEKSEGFNIDVSEIMKATENAVASVAVIAEETSRIEPSIQVTETVAETEKSAPAQTTKSNSSSNGSQKAVSNPTAPTPTPAPPTPAPDSNADKKFVTTCTCGATFSDANEWRAHRNIFKEKWFAEEITKEEMDTHNGYSQEWR